jgi:LuxR family transcriptional regulator, maltose regulon positive regulatory protein
VGCSPWPGRQAPSKASVAPAARKALALKQYMPAITLPEVNASIEGRASHRLERDPRSRVRPAFELVESKLHPPWLRPGIVPRTALVQRLLASHAAPVICVVAPPGYGKTTLLAQWATRKGGRVGWVTVDRRDNDPVVLLTYVAVALDRVEPIDPGVFGALAAPGVSVVGTVLPRLAAATAALTQPLGLVVDNVELLDNPQCLDALVELAAHLPTGSQLALAARATPRLPVALRAAPGRVVAIGVAELRMDQPEAHALLEGAGVWLGDAEATELVWRTEGWPVGLYLAALTRKEGPAGDPRQGGAGFSGDDRFVADYLWDELLSRLPQPTVSFLTRTAVLDRMCGPLCDAVLDTTGSAEVLASLAGANLLLLPLDRHRQWYRYHHLFRGLLRAELDRRAPELVAQLHLRAAAWCEANGLPETAIDHAQAAGDADRVARLVAGLARATYASGRVDTARRWVGWFDEQGLIARYPQVAVQGGLLHALLGHPAAANRWADAAERGAAAARAAGQEPSTMDAMLALLHAFLCRNGVERMRADAELTRARLGPDSQWRAPALLLEGTAYLLAGQADRADPILAHTVQVATHAEALPAASLALAERCIVALERNEWPRAETLTEQALGIVRAGQLDDYINSALVYAVAARTALHRRDLPRAHQHLARAARLRPQLTYAIPWLAVQALLELARAYLALDDVAGARMVLGEANDILRRRPDLGTLPQQAAQLRSKTSGIRVGIVGASSLTKAELRVLPLLPTHLTYREIGERLYLSHHTVKTQAISIHRKLGVSSRGQAVERARQLGLGV